MSPTRIILIRHGEKPAHGQPGLNSQGLERADSLIHVFGPKSPFKISHIVAQKPHENGKRARPSLTAAPLARSLGLEVDVSLEREDVKDVAEKVKGERKGDILVCWEHKRLHDIAQAHGVKDPPQYDGERYDLLWILEQPYDKVRVETYNIEGHDSRSRT